MSAPSATLRPPVTVHRRRPALLVGLGVTGWLAVMVLALVFILAAFGPLLTSQDPTSTELSAAYGGPTAGHPLGFDSSGRDLLARLVHGARTALLGPLAVVAVSTVLGVLLALTAIWYGGWFDSVFARVLDAMFAFPGLLLAILAAALFGPGLAAASVALSMAYTPFLARVVRGAALRERGLPYVAALRVQGFGGFTICARHILPNVARALVANATLSFGLAFLDLAALSFIGLGVRAPTPDWGAMVASGVNGILQNHPQESIYASVLIVVTVAATNLLGDRTATRAVNR